MIHIINFQTGESTALSNILKNILDENLTFDHFKSITSKVSKSSFSLKNAKHLLRRATFKYTKNLISQFSALTPQQALDLLTTNNPLV